MAIKLNTKPEPHRMVLVPEPHLIAVTVRPLTRILQSAARSYQQRMMKQLLSDWEAAKAAGGEIDGDFDLDDADEKKGVEDLFFAQGLARKAIVDWEGVLDEDGSVAALTPENIDAFVRLPHIGDIFVNYYMSSLADLLTEGND